jgi:hypothetical protein
MTAESMTTIKIPKQLRARVAEGAAREGVTAAALIATLLDEYERRLRFEAVRQAYADVDQSYVDETRAWDAVVGDGLESW